MESDTTKMHKKHAPKTLGFAVIVVSTSRYEKAKTGKIVEDPSGDLAVSLIEKAGHKVIFKSIIPDSQAMIRTELRKAMLSKEVDVIVFCGGTGVSPSDVTIETIKPFLEKILPGFGELFRWLSYQETGSAVILSRALGGVTEGKAVFCIPGSPQAVRLCFEKLILPEASHIVKHARER